MTCETHETDQDEGADDCQPCELGREVARLRAELQDVRTIMDSAYEFIFSGDDPDCVHVVSRSGDNWEVHLSCIMGGNLIEVFEGSGDREAAIARDAAIAKARELGKL